MANTREMSDEKTLLEEAFYLYDEDKRGYISVKDALSILHTFNIRMTSKDLENELTTDHLTCNQIDLSTYLTIVSSKLETNNSTISSDEVTKEEEIRNMFELLDKDDMNKISFNNLKTICNQVNYPLSDDEMNAMIDNFDSNLDGSINFDDFRKIMNMRITDL